MLPLLLRRLLPSLASALASPLLPQVFLVRPQGGAAELSGAQSPALHAAYLRPPSEAAVRSFQKKEEAPPPLALSRDRGNLLPPKMQK